MKKISKSLACILLSLSLGISGCGRRDDGVDKRNLSPQEYSALNLAATDELGRGFDIADAKKEGKAVGVFYSLWLGQHPSLTTDIRDIQVMIENDPDTLNDPTKDIGQFHFWGKPLYGYYGMTDPYVITRHIELFTMAGLDYLCIDATNEHIYEDAGKLLLETLQKYDAQGFNVPKVLFYTNTGSGKTVDKIYHAYYKSGKYDDMWYAPNGRPAIVGITENNAYGSDQFFSGNAVSYVSAQMQNYFDVWESQWPTGEYNENGYSWITWKLDRLAHNGHAALGVAQHSHASVYASSMDPECSRAYNNFTGKKEGDWREGKGFETMWEAVFQKENEINDVLCTSFNEWQAQKYPLGTATGFVDVYNWEYSRDMEMMEGGYGDNFYLQLVRNMRRFSFTEGKTYQTKPVAADISVDDAVWKNATAHYADFVDDAINRDHLDAAGKSRYTDNSARNDIAFIKVLHDEDNLYFRIETAEDMTEYQEGDTGWMNILIGTNEGKSFSGYQYIVNRSPGDGKTSVEKSKGGYDWENAGSADYRSDGNVLFIKIPRSVLGIGGGAPNITFKVCDNVTKKDDIMDYYVSGDCAPIGRLSYRYAA
jgi:hypothetical protein